MRDKIGKHISERPLIRVCVEKYDELADHFEWKRNDIEDEPERECNYPPDARKKITHLCWGRFRCFAIVGWNYLSYFQGGEPGGNRFQMVWSLVAAVGRCPGGQMPD